MRIDSLEGGGGSGDAGGNGMGECVEEAAAASRGSGEGLSEGSPAEAEGGVEPGRGGVRGKTTFPPEGSIWTSSAGRRDVSVAELGTTIGPLPLGSWGINAVDVLCCGSGCLSCCCC